VTFLNHRQDNWNHSGCTGWTQYAT